MQERNTQTAARQTNSRPFSGFDRDGELVHERLDFLLDINTETARQKAMYRSEREKMEAEMMANPLNFEKAFAYFGLLLGIFPPLAFFIGFFTDAGGFRFNEIWVFGLLAIVNLLTAIVGFFSGKIVGKWMRELDKYPLGAVLLLAPFIGILWSAVSGGAGGLVIFVFGAILGAFFGATVGGAALPLFIVLHRWLKKGEMIDRRHFLPIAFGITFIICAFILGL
ncbi:MAG TPA: hypothetical protein VK892_14375 [Pyrinomonadaceae bacterium]|nr:hypothetical protein [Pyrinomonadaceae bacterium]